MDTGARYGSSRKKMGEHARRLFVYRPNRRDEKSPASRCRVECMLSNSQQLRGVALTKADIRRRVTELGPWFHNLNLKGIMTAPEHALGDYPSSKWARFAGALTQTIAGRSVLD